MIRFEKVSFDKYAEGCIMAFGEYRLNSNLIREKIVKSYKKIAIPERKTVQSAGYDFIWQFENTSFPSGESLVIPTGIKVRMDGVHAGTFLGILPRSSIGFKYKVMLANTMGIIDADYYNNEQNEGHIFIKLINDGNKEFLLETGKGYAQGIFIPYLTTDNDSASGERKGGIGSTDEKK